VASKSYQFRTVALDGAEPGRRASGLALALGVNLLLLLALLGIGAFRPTAPDATSALVVDLLPQSDERESAPAARQKAARPVEQVRPQPPKPPVIPPITSPIPPRVPLQMIELTRQDYAAADIAALPKAGPPAGAGAGGSGADDSAVVGRGPHGETLYAAEWARHPTDAELGGYRKPGAPDGFGLIACKTAPGNRVEDCVELDQSPRGSHLASAVRQAAWQFRVRPPRKNGQPMIGEWVSIRIDYITTQRTQ
jgi:protein TonB